MLNLFQPGTGSNVLTLYRIAIGGKTSSAHVRAKHVIQHPVATATVKGVPNKGAKRPMGLAAMPCCSDSLLSFGHELKHACRTCIIMLNNGSQSALQKTTSSLSIHVPIPFVVNLLIGDACMHACVCIMYH